MTTTVKIEAHLSKEIKKVEVKLLDNSSELETFYLEDGEKAERYIYDNRELLVKEILK